MGIFDKLKGEFIDIIEWLDPSQDTMVYRFERYQNEIKYGAKLTVRESQVAVFVNEGQIADIYKPGMYTLETQNMPIMSTLKGWKFGFNSPFKAEIYFLNTKVFTNQKWGTKNPFMLRDPEFGPIRLKAFGSYAVRIKDPKNFILKVVGTDGHFTIDEINEQLRNTIITRFTNSIGSANIPALDLAGNSNAISTEVEKNINVDFDELGLECTKFFVENISFPPEVERMLDKRSSMGILGNLDNFNKMQTGVSMEIGSANPSGGAAAGIGMGMGMGMAQQMVNSMQQQQQPQQGGTPMPPPLAQFFVAVNGQQQGPYDMNTIANMIRGGQINQQSLIWKQGMANWQPASQVAEVAQLFGAVPPPMPPPIG